MPAALARKLLGPDSLLGVSVNTEEEMRIVLEEDVVDYIGVGPVYTTASKKDLNPVMGTRGVTRILGVLGDSPIKVVAIGGLPPPLPSQPANPDSQAASPPKRSLTSSLNAQPHSLQAPIAPSTASPSSPPSQLPQPLRPPPPPSSPSSALLLSTPPYPTSPPPLLPPSSPLPAFFWKRFDRNATPSSTTSPTTSS